MDKEKLVELAKAVAIGRRNIETVKKEKASAEELVAKSVEGIHVQVCTEHLESKQKALTEAEDQLRSAVVRLYGETKDKKPISGVEVKIHKWLEYDAAEVLEWCREKATTLLTVNKKPFEKTAMNIGAPVKEKTEPRCGIAKDLSMYLEAATEAA